MDNNTVAIPDNVLRYLRLRGDTAAAHLNQVAEDAIADNALPSATTPAEQFAASAAVATNSANATGFALLATAGDIKARLASNEDKAATAHKTSLHEEFDTEWANTTTTTTTIEVPSLRDVKQEIANFLYDIYVNYDADAAIAKIKQFLAIVSDVAIYAPTHDGQQIYSVNNSDEWDVNDQDNGQFLETIGFHPEETNVRGIHRYVLQRLNWPTFIIACNVLCQIFPRMIDTDDTSDRHQISLRGVHMVIRHYVTGEYTGNSDIRLPEVNMQVINSLRSMNKACFSGHITEEERDETLRFFLDLLVDLLKMLHENKPRVIRVTKSSLDYMCDGGSDLLEALGMHGASVFGFCCCCLPDNCLVQAHSAINIIRDLYKFDEKKGIYVPADEMAETVLFKNLVDDGHSSEQDDESMYDGVDYGENGADDASSNEGSDNDGRGGEETKVDSPVNDEGHVDFEPEDDKVKENQGEEREEENREAVADFSSDSDDDSGERDEATTTGGHPDDQTTTTTPKARKQQRRRQHKTNTASLSEGEEEEKEEGVGGVDDDDDNDDDNNDDTGDDVINEDVIKSLTVEKLKPILKNRGLSTTGPKGDLVNRLLQDIADNADADNADASDESSSDEVEDEQAEVETIDYSTSWECCEVTLSAERVKCGNCKRWRGGRMPPHRPPSEPTAILSRKQRLTNFRESRQRSQQAYRRSTGGRRSTTDPLQYIFEIYLKLKNRRVLLKDFDGMGLPDRFYQLMLIYLSLFPDGTIKIGKNQTNVLTNLQRAVNMNDGTKRDPFICLVFLPRRGATKSVLRDVEKLMHFLCFAKGGQLMRDKGFETFDISSIAETQEDRENFVRCLAKDAENFFCDFSSHTVTLPNGEDLTAKNKKTLSMWAKFQLAKSKEVKLGLKLVTIDGNPYIYRHLTPPQKHRYHSTMEKLEWESYFNAYENARNTKTPLQNVFTEDIAVQMFRDWVVYQKDYWGDLNEDQQNRLTELGFRSTGQRGVTFDEAGFISNINAYDEWQKREENKNKIPSQHESKEEKRLYYFVNRCARHFTDKTSWAKVEDERNQRVQQLKDVGLDLEAIINDRKLKREMKKRQIKDKRKAEELKRKAEELKRKKSKLDPAYMEATYSVKKLHKMCKERELLCTGLKRDIIQRIIKHDRKKEKGLSVEGPKEDTNRRSKRSTRSSTKKDESAASQVSRKGKRRRLG